MKVRGLVAASLLLAAGCAGAWRGPKSAAPRTDAVRGWAELAEGNDTAAAASFARALARDPADARALFGAANLAYEQGQVDGALARALDLLEAASRGQEIAVGLSMAVLARLPRLLEEIPDRRPAEARLLALAPRRLPWQAQYALALLVIDIARKRADAELLAEAAARVGCAKSIDYVGTGGRLPLLDLAADTLVPVESPRPLVPAGCLFEINTTDGRMGVKVLRSRFDLPGGRYEIVLNFAGAARVRVDGGPWHLHGGSLEVYGPRWSAFPVTLAAGKHQVEIRLGMHGASAELALLAIPAARLTGPGDVSASEAPMLELARALSAHLAGDSDAVQEQTERLGARVRFALGLAAAGRLGRLDMTRPLDVMRDKARALWQQAVTVDSRLARVWLDLSDLEMQQERPREAAAHAERSRQLAPGWWPAQLGLASAWRAQGLEQPADEALAAGLALVEPGWGGCQMIESALHRKRDRQETAAVDRLVSALGRCDAQNPHPRTWAQERGRLDEALAQVARALPTSAEPLWVQSELAEAHLARGEPALAAGVLADILDRSPRNTRAWIRLADAQTAMGKPAQARATLAEALRRLPARQDLHRAARLLGLALPLDDFRVAGGKVVSDFLASGRRYQAPAVVVLDRAVERVFSDGGRLMLTHTITQVLSKNAVEQVGEVHVPHGAQILALRTRKADGTLREAEKILGKTSISAPNLGVGDFVETETLEFKSPREAFAPGFVGERFYFQSFDAPLDRSEYVLIAPVDRRLDVDARAGAPVPSEARGADGTRILTFVRREQPQLFPERSAVPAVEWIPSVRVSSGVTLELWSRFVAERFARVPRGSPEIRRLAARIAAEAGGNRDKLAEAVVDWVRENIEPENSYVESATATAARGRGNRAGLVIALLRSLGVPADLVFARSRLTAEATAPIEPAQLDDFHEALVRIPRPEGDRFVAPRLRHAPFGFVPSGLDGAKAIVVGTSKILPVATTVPDDRRVTLRARLAADGSAEVAVSEDVSGWPALEWSEMLDRAGKDRTKLRQEFEQRWLGHHFPGAELDTLDVDAGVGRARVRYAFKAAGFADRRNGELRLRPIFFRARPGRRFCTEPQRKTTLLLGPDVPLELDAEFVLPAGAEVLDVGQSGEVSAAPAAFVERRQVVDGGSVRVRRRSRLPLMRVPPGEYQAVAARLRAVDSLEQAEIRVAAPDK
ncbi:MAG: tetratricopeptide repeat protein [Deltaproteobacteria bacterium]|nr:tetratricopeptide repeat protein [Deltaproteobacteria bacterium]